MLDLRWLAPLPHAAVRRHADECGAVLIADECRATGAGIADALIARLVEDGCGKRIRSVRGVDTYVPLGPAAGVVSISDDQIVAAAKGLVR